MLILGVSDIDCLGFSLVQDGHSVDMPQYLPETIDSIVYAGKPYLTLARTVETHIALAPKMLPAFCRDMPRLIRETVYKKRDLIRQISTYLPPSSSQKILFADRQTCLCADAFYPTRHEEAAVLCLDDMDEWASASIAIGKGAGLTIEQEILYPHSLGFLMDAFADYIGVDRARMDRLASEGEPTYARMLARSVIDIKQDGSFLLNQHYFDYAKGGDWTNEALHDLMGGAARFINEPIDQRHRNIAASVMAITGQIASLMVHAIAREYRGMHNLCVTGSVVHEHSVRKRIVRDHAFDHVDISCNTGNQALSNGAALAGYYMHHKRSRDIMFLQKSAHSGAKIKNAG
jgi:carbamoyltransferase